eukprot:11187109-Lingulodinium_polyedra.AAC.1
MRQYHLSRSVARAGADRAAGFDPQWPDVVRVGGGHAMRSPCLPHFCQVGVAGSVPQWGAFG